MRPRREQHTILHPLLALSWFMVGQAAYTYKHALKTSTRLTLSVIWGLRRRVHVVQSMGQWHRLACIQVREEHVFRRP